MHAEASLGFKFGGKREGEQAWNSKSSGNHRQKRNAKFFRQSHKKIWT